MSPGPGIVPTVPGGAHGEESGFRRQLIRSVGVSLLSFGLDFGVLALLTEAARLHYLFSAAISFLLGTTLSWILSVLWVFEVRTRSSKAVEYGLFVLVGVIGLGLNEALLWLLTDRWGVYYLLSKTIAASLVFFWNFGMRKTLLFR
jgi:putative flippase GtrA